MLLKDDWIPISENRYYKNAYLDLVKSWDNRDVIDSKDLHTEEDYIRAINILNERLHCSKNAHRENAMRYKNDIKYYKELYEKEREEKFKAQKHEFPEEGMIYFSESIRNYFIQGLEEIKEYWLKETMPDSIRYETDIYGEYIEEYNEKYDYYFRRERPIEESKAEWGKLISKMITSNRCHFTE